MSSSLNAESAIKILEKVGKTMAPSKTPFALPTCTALVLSSRMDLIDVRHLPLSTLLTAPWITAQCGTK